jgi:hypothetical protein
MTVRNTPRDPGPEPLVGIRTACLFKRLLRSVIGSKYLQAYRLSGPVRARLESRWLFLFFPPNLVPFIGEKMIYMGANVRP